MDDERVSVTSVGYVYTKKTTPDLIDYGYYPFVLLNNEESQVPFAGSLSAPPPNTVTSFTIVLAYYIISSSIITES